MTLFYQSALCKYMQAMQLDARCHVHVMVSIFTDKNTDTKLLIETKIGFNPVNKEAFVYAQC